MASGVSVLGDQAMFPTMCAFLAGMREFRSIVTSSYDDEALSDWYDRGRDLAHSITLRVYDC
jgi:hypothetical protein